jgi:hypoxanthine phosphoribosyltransferase
LEDRIPVFDGSCDEGLPFITELEIRHRISILARQIAADFQDEDFCVVSVLKGSFMLLADLLRRLSELGLKPTVDFIRAASYGPSTSSSGEVSILMNVTNELRGKAALVVDDIIDTGRTLSAIREHLINRGASSVSTCVLLDKPSRREVDFQPDYTGFRIPDKFVVGYGMDFDEEYRYLPYITVLKD